MHPDGTIFTLGCDGYNPLILGIDGSTGALKFSVPVTVVGYNWDWYGMIIAGDGYAYAAYGYADNIQGTPCTGMDSHLKLLRIDSSGNYNNIDVVNVHTSDCNVDGWLPFGANMITNADQGIMFTWGDWYGNSFMAVTAGNSVSVFSVPMAPAPVLQAQDGSFFGTVTTWDGSYAFNIVSFDIAGNVRWMVPMTNPFPQIATADGGLIVNDYDGTAWTAITFDKDGNATGQLPSSSEVYAWDQEWYDLLAGIVTDVVQPPLRIATGWATFAGGSPSPNGAYIGATITPLEDALLWALPVRGPSCEIAEIGPHHLPGVKAPLVGDAYYWYRWEWVEWGMGNYLTSPSCGEFLGKDPARSAAFSKINNPLAWQFAYDGLNTNISWYDAGMVSAADLYGTSDEAKKLVKLSKQIPICGKFVTFQGVERKASASGKVVASSQIYGPGGGQATDVYFNSKPKIIRALRQSTVVHETLHNLSGLYDDTPDNMPMSYDLNLENLMGLPTPGQCQVSQCPCQPGSTVCISNAVVNNGCAGN